MAYPALTREQMLDRCDLAGIARVISVGRPHLDSAPVAKLIFVRTVKGAPRERGGFVYVRLHGTAAPRIDGGLGSWSDWRDYPVGGLVMTHLDWSGPEEVYQTTWPGAVGVLDEQMARVA